MYHLDATTEGHQEPSPGFHKFPNVRGSAHPRQVAGGGEGHHWASGEHVALGGLNEGIDQFDTFISSRNSFSCLKRKEQANPVNQLGNNYRVLYLLLHIYCISFRNWFSCLKRKEQTNPAKQLGNNYRVFIIKMLKNLEKFNWKLSLYDLWTFLFVFQDPVFNFVWSFMPNINPDGYAITFEGKETGYKNAINSFKVRKFYASKFSTVIVKINVSCGLKIVVDSSKKILYGHRLADIS
jgi:hypothetical protein